MKLRLILVILAAQAFLFASLGGYLYYSSLKKAAFKEAEQRYMVNVEMVKRNLSSFLTQYIKPIRAMAEMQGLKEALILSEVPGAIERANQILDTYKQALEVQVCYLMNRQGTTIATTNRGSEDSFLDKNFSFRPYFQKAISGEPFAYLALGTVSDERGVYYSHPVIGGESGKPLGVVVIKASIEYIESEFLTPFDEIFLVASQQGLIFISNKEEWLYETLRPMNHEVAEQVEASKQFGSGPWEWSGLTIQGDRATDAQGHEYLVYRKELERFPGWELIHLYNQQAVTKLVSSPFLKVVEPLAILISLVVGISVFVLYRKASRELTWRKKAEDDLRQSESKYRSLYHNTPAMLHSIDANYRFLTVSDFWLEATGYTRSEVIGRKLTEFFTPESREYAESTVLPRFFRTGFSKDVPYRFVKKSGEVMDIVLSCFGIMDENGQIGQTLAVSVDVTERNKAQEELKRMQEKLKEYSRELELLVLKRTREINSILQYTPSVIYIKGRDLKYHLVNPRFEHLFGISNEEAQGRFDSDILPGDTAEQFRRNDLQVLELKKECQFTEHLNHPNGRHTYISVKFPIYGETGEINGVCGIATDITELQEAQDKLRHLSRSIITNQENERAAISRELHDELGQLLTTLRMDAAWLQNHLPEIDGKAAKRASFMVQVVDKAIDQVRDLTQQIRPCMLDDLGLTDALQQLVADFERRTGISYIFDSSGLDDELDDTRATAVYRIVQEGMTNAARHARASHVSIRLAKDNGQLSISIEDDGRGFDPDNLSSSAIGITGMQERTVLLDGQLQIDSSPGQGTRIACTIPL